MKSVFCILLLSPFFVFAETLYVQSQKTSLKAEANMNAAEVASLIRGDELTLIETKGAWLQVKKADQQGWVSKLFVSKNKPVGTASLAQEVTASEAKTSRRREATYSVSASTRGLMPVQRSRSGRESYQSDNQALEIIQKRQISDSEINGFIEKAESRK